MQKNIIFLHLVGEKHAHIHMFISMFINDEMNIVKNYVFFTELVPNLAGKLKHKIKSGPYLQTTDRKKAVLFLLHSSKK